MLIVERIWATWYSSFAIIKTLLGCVAGTKMSPSTEVLLEQIFLALIVIHIAVAEFYVGRCISWEHTNRPNLARVADMQHHKHHHHTHIEEFLAAGKQHGQRIKHINFGPFLNPIHKHPYFLVLSTLLFKPEGNCSMVKKKK